MDDHTTGLATGDVVSNTHSLQRPLVVLTDTQPLRVMLAWTDPPASLYAAVQLVNDLDLIVVGPDGTNYYGNHFTSGDRINNVEGTVIHTPIPGPYQVAVRSFNVPIASQPYALVVAGPIKTADALSLAVAKTANVATAEAGSTVTYTYQVTNTGNITLTDIIAYDNKLGSVPFQLSSLNPRQSLTAILSYTVQTTDFPGPLINIVTVTGTSAIQPGAVTSATAQETVNLSNGHSITVTKSANVNTARIGQTITYTFRVTNTGNVPLTGLVGYDDKLGSISFDPDQLAVTQSATGILTYTIQQSTLTGPLRNTAIVSSTAATGTPTLVTAWATETVTLLDSPTFNIYVPVILK